MTHLSQPLVELADLCWVACPGEVSRVYEDVSVRDLRLEVGGQGVGVRHADEPQLNIPELAER